MLPYGYVRKGSRYTRYGDGNIVVLELRGGSVSDFANLDAHLGVLSARLARVFGPKMAVSRPGPHECHWYRWGGDLNVADQPESGWDVDLVDGKWQTAVVERQLSAAVLPALEQHNGDEGLRDDWLARRDTWLTEAEQLAYLIVLVKDLGPEERLPGLQQRLRLLVANGDPDAERVARHPILDWSPKFD